MIPEKVPSPSCEKCGSYQVIITAKGQECDECARVVGFSVKKPKLKERCHKIIDTQERK